MKLSPMQRLLSLRPFKKHHDLVSCSIDAAPLSLNLAHRGTERFSCDRLRPPCSLPSQLPRRAAPSLRGTKGRRGGGNILPSCLVSAAPAPSSLGPAARDCWAFNWLPCYMRLPSFVSFVTRTRCRELACVSVCALPARKKARVAARAEVWSGWSGFFSAAHGLMDWLTASRPFFFFF